MEIIKQDFLKNLKQIVEVRAKYQKVMLIYDENTIKSNITQIYETIKEICIYNEMCAINFDKNELNNGYKLVIYLMDANNFLKLDINKSEFVNVFVPQNNCILPFYVDENFKFSTKNDYLFLKDGWIDIGIETSFLFNKVYEYFNNLIQGRANNWDFEQYADITQNSQINMLLKISSFEDVKLIHSCNIDIKNLPLVDLILIDAFKVLIMSISNNLISLVDCYKAIKDNVSLIEKFYAMYSSNIFVELVKLNSINVNQLFNIVETKLGSLKCFFSSQKYENLDSLIEKIKNYIKNSEDFLANLYLYNVFGV